MSFLDGRQRIGFINAPLAKAFNIITDLEKFPEYFPKVADSIRVEKREGDCLEMNATVKSFGQKFLIKMKTRIIPGKGFVSDNESSWFGTSSHEELLLSESAERTVIDYTYQVVIHKRWFRIVAKSLIGWFFLKHWKKLL